MKRRPTHHEKAFMANLQDLQNGADVLRLDSLIARVRGEYSEMPGLRLTCAQACRLWHMHVSTCEELLKQLVKEGFLCKTDKGAYIAAPTIRRRT
jgi:DNA-binding IclR family transcriptional regulator